MTIAENLQARQKAAVAPGVGTRANVIRLRAPLTIGEDTLEEGLDILEASIEAAFSAVEA